MPLFRSVCSGSATSSGIFIVFFEKIELQFLVIKTIDSDPDSLEMLDPDSMNPDTQL